MKKIILTLTLILLYNIGFTQNTIDPRLQNVLDQKNNEDIAINILFKAQVDLAKLSTRADATLDKKTRRDILVEELKLFSEESQQEVLSILQAETRSHKVTNIRTHWLSNAISCTANRDVIYLLAQHPDIELIGYDEIVKMIFDEEKQSANYRQQADEEETSLTDNIIMVNADKVWEMGYTGKGVIVAVIDTGVNYNHADLADHLWDGGAQYPHHGYNTIDNNDDTMDRAGHGTHCAGTICGDGTSGILTGIAPDATLMCLKALDDSGSGNASSINAAMEFAIENHADILSMSLGILCPSATNKAMLRRTCVKALDLGVVATVAVGNHGQNMTPDAQVPNNVLAPADCPPPWLHPDQQKNPGELSCVVAVGAVDYNENMYENGSVGPVTWSDIVEFSDYPYNDSKIGLIRPDVCAPGVGIKSLDHNNNNGYNLKTGTSMATPCVAGVIALMLEKQNNFTPAEVCMTLETTAKKLTETKSNMFGTGLIDAFKAISSMRVGSLAATNISIDDSDFNNNGNLNAGETVKLSLNVINDSEEEYNNIKAVISCPNELVTITDAEATIEKISAKGNVALNDEFEFTADENIDYKTALYFDFKVYDENDSCIASSNFSIDIKYNELEFASFIVKNDDNGNGALEAGETADLGIILNNIGNEIAVKVKGTLSNSDNSVTINQGEAEFSSIGANASGIAYFNITVSENVGEELDIPFDLKVSDLLEKESTFNANYSNVCSYIVQLGDSFKDGWNGAALLVKYSDGTPTDTLTISYGAFGEYRLDIKSNVTVTLEWMGKDENDKECTFVVAVAGTYEVIYQCDVTLSETTSFLYSWVNDCSCENEYYAMREAVKDLKGEQNGNGIQLSWKTGNGQLALSAYEIYRGSILLGTTEEETFTDNTISEAGSYIYSVRPVYESNDGYFDDVTVAFSPVMTNENAVISASVYPNPSKGDFTISCNDMTSVTVYNIVGNRIMETEVDADNYVINGLESGVYFVEIKTNEGNTVKRILKF